MEIVLPHPVVLCVMYIPPAAPASLVSSTICFLSDIVTQHACILLGDFNFPDINWRNLSSATPSGNLFCEFVFDHNLVQLVDSPTHVKGNTLDLVLCNSTNLISDVLIGSNELSVGLQSDHKSVEISIPCNATDISRCSVPRFIFAKGDYDGLNHYFEFADFSAFNSSWDIEFQWSFLKSLILEGCDLFIPKSKSTLSHYPR